MIFYEQLQTIFKELDQVSESQRQQLHRATVLACHPLDSNSETLYSKAVDDWIRIQLPRLEKGSLHLLKSYLLSEYLGYGILDEALRYTDWSEISFQNGAITVDFFDGRIFKTKIFSEAHLLQIIRRIANDLSVRIDERFPLLDKQWNGLRLNACIPPVSKSAYLKLTREI